MGHLEYNKLLASYQHGFRRKRSGFLSKISFLNKVASRLDKGKRVEICYLDFQKAFNSVNHRLPSKIIEHIAFRRVY